MSKLRILLCVPLMALAGAGSSQSVQRNSQLGSPTVDMGGSSAPASWLRTNLPGAWPGLLIENTAKSATAQTQVFWKRWDAEGHPLVWQINIDVDDNRGFKGLFNMEAIDLERRAVVATPVSMARTGEVGIGTGTPMHGQQLTVGGDTRVRRNAGTASDGAVILGSNSKVQLYGDSARSLMAFYANGSEAVRIQGANVLVGTAADSGDRLQVAGTVKASALQLKPTTVASLPPCTTKTEGRLASVTDASSAAFNAPAVAGGSNHMMAYCNGARWTVR